MNNWRRGIITSRHKISKIRMKSVVAYKDNVRIGDYESISHASRILDVSVMAISRSLNHGSTTKDGYKFYNTGKEPLREEYAEKRIVFDENDRVAIFDKDSHQYINSYKNVRQFASSMGRPLKTVVGWLNGERCTDPDFYYKYESRCSEEELKNKYEL